MRKILLVLLLLVGTAFAQEQDYSDIDDYIEAFTTTAGPIVTYAFQITFTPEIQIDSSTEKLLRRLIPRHITLLDIGIRYGYITEEKREEQMRFIQIVQKKIGEED